MWIRSQNKSSLRNYNGLFIDQTNKKVICGDANDNGESWFTIGEYSSEEKALEVLNNIQDVMIVNSGKVNDTKINCYEMPEE